MLDPQTRLSSPGGIPNEIALEEAAQDFDITKATKEKRVGSTFPATVFDKVDTSYYQGAPEHLSFLSEKLGATEDLTHYYHSARAGEGVVVYLVDSGFGPVRDPAQVTSPVSVVFTLND